MKSFYVAALLLCVLTLCLVACTRTSPVVASGGQNAASAADARPSTFPAVADEGSPPAFNAEVSSAKIVMKSARRVISKISL